MRKLLIIYFAFYTAVAFSQQEVKTNDNKTVILNNNFTWEYKKEQLDINSNLEIDCNEYIEHHTDKMTGSKSIFSKTILVSDDGGDTGFGISANSSEHGLLINILTVGASNCIKKENNINILFRDGTRIESQNFSDFNCEGNSMLIFSLIEGNDNNLKKLSSTEIETMRVWTAKGFVEKDFTSKNSIDLINTLKCMLKQ